MLRRLKSAAYKSAVWALRTFNPGEIRIRHHYTGKKFSLEAFKHKGYWFHGKRREAGTMRFFKDLLGPDDVVLEAGGHIGYLTTYFAHLCGSTGHVYVFEPDEANLIFLRRNAASFPQITIIEKAVGSSSGPRDFFIENITGQNNSFYSDYETFEANSKMGGFKETYHKTQVEVTTIDDFSREIDRRISLIKIDIEGAELEALHGMKQLAKEYHPIIMVEVSRNVPEVFDWLKAQGYLLFNEHRKRLHEPITFNVFCLHPEIHKTLIERLKLEA